ncbi:MAG: amidohydrolase [Roseibacillus sp.]|jgi:imidazolonepropionase-like amidohydrolase|nr:amidohydrolase [Roseibacillus sp.]MBP36351.1 amidohydrolase [Roseibacillus sp.]MCP4730434.1 amidohydrolase family protein [Roseibacillus sp.]MDP7306145.1 amidohydrolase family protein [Roseibacillus sp.]MDP7656702.1 amidohydrolase family protein [Roseibacillus sp.]|tara:strand:+ start:2682 stop:3995 length:1314 start_codon:yes stop_codon:yes gene_type:complete
MFPSLRYLFPLLVLALIAVVSLGGGHETPVPLRAYVGARIIPVTAPEIVDGVLLVRGETIAAVGKRGEVVIPDDAEVIEVKGKILFPGLICTHSHIGKVQGGDGSSPIQPDVRVLDSIDVLDSTVEKARAGGITMANLMSGSGHLLSGQTAYLKLRDGNTIEDLAVRNEDGSMAGGIKMANGTNSIKGSGGSPGTRGKSAALVRAQFLKARRYREKLAQGGDDPPERDLAMEALVEVLEGKRVVHHHTHRHDDIITVLRLKKEFGFKVVLHHVSEAWKVADEIAEAKVPCSIIYLDSPGGKLEARDLEWKNGAELEKRGVLTAFHTDDPINDSRWFLRSAGLAVRSGMSRQKALEAVTIAGAEMMDQADQTGSLTVGKKADFVILNGDPLSVYTRVLETHVEGKKVFDLDDPRDKLWAEGGFGAGHKRRASGCCFTR